MSKQTENSLFMLSPFRLKQAGFYQDLLRGISGYQQLGNRLAHLAEQAHAFRQFVRVREYARLLSNIPIKTYQTIGHYYLAVATNSMGNGNQEEARKLFGLVTNTAPEPYKAKALLSLAAVAANARDYQTQLGYMVEAARASKDVSTTARAHLGIAIYKSMEGSHPQALKDLENLYPLARYSQPAVFFDYLNSLAVELGEAGRKDEARNIMRVVLASPFIPAYPEWQETAQELKPANRSFVAINPLSGPNVLRFKPTERAEETETATAKVLTFMAKKDQTKPDEQEPKMTKAEKAKWLRLRILSDEFPEDLLNEMIRMAREQDQK